MAYALLIWAQVYMRVTTGKALVGAALACGLAAIPGLICAALPHQGPTPWLVLTILGVGTALTAMHFPIPKSSHGDGAAPWSSEVPTLWQPLVGLTLSLISMALPWGAFLDTSATSVPPLWGVALGWAVPAVILVAFCGGRPTDLELDKRRFTLLSGIGIPALAALTMALWMVGDVANIAFLIGVLKGVGSGIACTSLFCLAWVRMTRPLANASQANKTAGDEEGQLTTAANLAPASLAFVFLIAALILPVHALFGRNAAGTISPVASLVFLVAVCVDSAIRLSRGMQSSEVVPTHARPAEKGSPDFATAIEVIAQERGLSQREQEVLGCLMGARSIDGIAAELGISPHTVRTHIRRIHEKLGVSSRDEVVTFVEAARR